ncbi:MAG: glycosyltransferase [Ramlibacter sp.]|jgi:glycosyltransferase involved in cell wall biosynthesis|nr:glycosyltransferase [Ramlibacter sp.]
MRLLLDLQGCQSGGSRSRGIGRYSMALAKGLIRNGERHEFWLLLNAAFPDTLAPVREAFDGLIPPERIVVFSVPQGCAEVAHARRWRTRAAELIRHHAIRAVNPDVVHVSSLFEGLVDDAATSIEPAPEAVPCAVTLYDLIPLLHPQRYLADPRTKAWYSRKIQSLGRADLLLGISASACAEAVAELPERKGKVVNISSAADPQFRPDGPRVAAARLGLTREFVMYTGGIDWRKNIDGLVRAFAALPRHVRSAHQLALVCHAEPYARSKILAMTHGAGLSDDDVVVTGYVSDEDLADLYRSCALFVFPSLHEGFGLPALEAMMCGAVVIGSNTSSIPEVIGRPDALFDPRSSQSIADLMLRALQDQPFRQSLREHAAVQSARFSWDQTAKRALDALEELHERSRAVRPATAPQNLSKARPRLAMHAPLPPTQSGIADYTTELLGVLVEYYDIELICDQREVTLPATLSSLPVRTTEWFREHADGYDRVVYQIGNSILHAHMFALLRQFPGVVVLHDFFLSGVFNWMESLGMQPDALTEALFASHGPLALETDRAEGRDATVMRYPANRLVIERAIGVIVHSSYAMEAADQWYGRGVSSSWRQIAHLRTLPPAPDRAGARAALGLSAGDVLVCSFGHIQPTKLNHRLLQAWMRSSLGRERQCRLVLVGKNARPPYGDQVAQLVRECPVPGQVAITGYADRELYERYLCAADIAVQLRTMSRGETSGAILDCLAFGVPLIANANGSAAEYPAGLVSLLPDAFTDDELIDALERLRNAPGERERQSVAGREWVARHHDPARIGREYRDAIEQFSADPHDPVYRQLVERIAELGQPERQDDLVDTAVAIAATPFSCAG